MATQVLFIGFTVKPGLEAETEGEIRKLRHIVFKFVCG